jgi:hypothetical protein
VVLAEANGPQRGIYDQFAEITRQPLVSVARTTDKHMRAAAAQPFVQAGKLMFPTDERGTVLPAFQPVIDELLAFPAGAHDDTVDTVVDLCGEATRGSLSTADMRVERIERPDAISRMFGAGKTTILRVIGCANVQRITEHIRKQQILFAGGSEKGKHRRSKTPCRVVAGFTTMAVCRVGRCRTVKSHTANRERD